MRSRIESGAWRPWTANALFESALIVFSVLLALTVDGLDQIRVIRHYLEDVTAAEQRLLAAYDETIEQLQRN